MWVGVLLATAVGATGFAIVDQAPSSGGGPAVERLLPPDGAAWEVVDEQYGAFGVEASRFTGFTELFDLPDLVAFGIADALADAGVDVQDARFYREIWTPLESTDPEQVSTQITAVYWLADDGIRLASLSGGASGFVYRPMQLVVPEAVSPGATWASEGDALPGGLLQYASTGSAAEGEDGCLEITTETTLTDPAEPDPGTPAAIVSTSLEVGVWCRGAGVLASVSFVNGVESSATTRPVGGGTDGLASAAAPPTPTPTSAWVARSMPIVSIDPVFGETEQFLVVAPVGATTASGVSVVASGRDVVGMVVRDDRAITRFIAHPGGDIVGISAVGDLVLVATSERRLVAYDDRGARRWAVGFGDIVLGGVVGVGSVGRGDVGLLAVALDGEVRRIAAADGATVWSTSIGVDVALPATPIDASVGGADVVVGGRDGTIVAIDAETGAITWTSDTEAPVAIEAVGGRMLVLTGDGTLVALDAATGERDWIRTTDGATALLTVDDGAVVHSSTGLEAFSELGERTWRREATVAQPIDGIVGVGDGLAVLAPDAVVLLDAGGEVVAETALPSSFASIRVLMLPRVDGLVLVTGNGELRRIGPAS